MCSPLPCSLVQGLPRVVGPARDEPGALRWRCGADKALRCLAGQGVEERHPAKAYSAAENNCSEFAPACSKEQPPPPLRSFTEGRENAKCPIKALPEPPTPLSGDLPQP